MTASPVNGAVARLAAALGQPTPEQRQALVTALGWRADVS